MKVGTVALIGRPNSGKSTLVNNLVGQKVAITSPRPQTTQFSTYAVMEGEVMNSHINSHPNPLSWKEGEKFQIVFVDTPGIFAHSPRSGQAKSVNDINLDAERALKEEIDVILYVVDHTRRRGHEENKVLGILRKIDKPKILVINKIDIREKSYIEEYKFLEDEFDNVVEISALRPLNLPLLVDAIYEYLPEGEKIVEKLDMPTPAMNLDSKLYISENIREKAYLVLREELPYKIRVVVDDVDKRDNGMFYIKARILVADKKYKKMVIGAGGQKIKVIGSMTRKELEVATGQRIFLDLHVEEEE